MTLVAVIAFGEIAFLTFFSNIPRLVVDNKNIEYLE